ncbi:hypothetical protein [uncultured Christiangramia sp.]|uniref:hypothetical protein n=1 Tax=Christiangramia sp. 3-2217-3z TaxID=3417564 RepID=UPI0026212DF0|nr:hypothetical protein [uncultured Christiangramia sp.]
MRKITIYCGFLLIAIGCSKSPVSEDLATNQESSSEISKPIKEFKDWEDFQKTYHAYNSMPTDDLRMMSQFSLDRELPVSFAVKAILNEDLEFIVDNELVWYSEGSLLVLDQDQPIDYQKQNASDLNRIGEIRESSGVGKEPSSDQTKITMDLNDVDSRYQKQIHRYDYVDQCGQGVHYGPKSKDFKYVYEVKTESVSYGYQYTHTLFFNIKLEYNARSGRWTSAGERRKITIDVTDYSSLVSGGGYVYTGGSIKSINKTLNCTQDQSFAIRSYYDIKPLAYNTKWNVSLKGKVTQQMIGDSDVNKITTNLDW